MTNCHLQITRSNDSIVITQDGLEKPLRLSLEDAADVAAIVADIGANPTPTFPKATGPQIVVQLDPDGNVYVTREEIDHFNQIEHSRGGMRRTIESLANNCELSEGEYIVFPLKEERKPSAKVVKKPAKKRSRK